MNSLPPLFTLEVIREIIDHNKARKPSQDIVEKYGLTKCLTIVSCVDSVPTEDGSCLVFKDTGLLVSRISRMAKQDIELLKKDYPRLTNEMIYVALRTDDNS